MLEKQRIKYISENKIKHVLQGKDWRGGNVLEREREEIERSFKAGKQVYPDFRLSLLVRLEA